MDGDVAAAIRREPVRHSSQQYLHCQSLLIPEKVDKTVKIEASTVEIEERGVKLRLTVVDTPGFADAINNDDR